MFKTLSVIFFFLGSTLSAQSIKVEGTIKDSIGNPLEFANVIVSIKSSGATETYGITNHEGRFKLNLPKGNTYILRASFLGYETEEQIVNVPVDTENIELDFILKPQENRLDDVEIVYEMPVTVKGDTIVYNADSFTTGDERKLGDVMKKLPGVAVNEDGEIQVEGKTVSKVMVEGKDFFDGDSKLATKNIPADAVDKVEVLRNYNEVTQMRGLGNHRDNVAINIKLKAGKKNFWFGEITGGAGVADEYGNENGRYLLHPKLFYYSPKYSINIITDFNNIGEVPFTFRDYFNFTGGFKNFNRKGGTNLNIRDSDLGFAVSQNDRAQAIDAKFVAANFSYAINEKLDISGFGILSDNRTNIVNNSIRQYILTGIIENTNSKNDQRNQLAILKLSSVFKPNHNFQLDYDALVKTSKQTEDDATVSIVGGNLNEISETKENRPFSINQTVNAYYTLNDKNIFAAEVQHLHQNEDPFYQAVQDSIPFRGVFTVVNPLDPFNSNADIFDPLEQSDRYNINQNKTVHSYKLDAKVDYYYVLNNLSNLNFSAGTTFSNQKFNSGIFQILENGNQNFFTGSNFYNDVTFTFTDVFLGLHYKLKSGKFIFTPGVTLHNYHLKNEQLEATSTQNEWMVLPDVNVIWELKKSENLRFNYAITSEYSDVNNYAEAYVFNNYNRLFRGNRELENSLSHSYSLTYFSFNLFNYTNIGGNLGYTKRVDAIKTNTQLVGINQVSRPVNFDSNFPDETFSVVGRFSKTVKKVQFKLDAAVFVSKTNNNINGEIRESQSFTQNYNASVLSNFKSFPNFEVGYRFMKNDYDNAGAEQIFYTNRPYANVDVRFLKYFNLFSEWDYYRYTNGAKTIENSYSFFNANLYYKHGESPWEFAIQATNILDTQSINNDSFNEQFSTTSQYFGMPRIVMFVIKYDL